MFRLGYNTNGLPHHRLDEALELIAALGYRAVALTPDVGQLDPYRTSEGEVREVARRCADLGLEVTIETGARFVMDPRRKHFPTLLEDAASDRERRIDFLERCVELGAAHHASVVSFWAGRAPDDLVADWPAESRGDVEHLWERLCEGVAHVVQRGSEAGVKVAFEPEPGMFIATPAGYDELCERLGAPGKQLALCLDVGHCLCTGEAPIAEVISGAAPRLGQVHLDDIAGGVHEHRMFGEGDLDLPATLLALGAACYEGVAAVELSRDGHRGAQAAEEAMGHLRSALQSAGIQVD